MNVDCENYLEIDWLLDSGCTDYLINDLNYYENSVILKKPVEVKLPDGKNLKATRVGTVETHLRTYHDENKIKLQNVYFVEGLNKNFLSFSKITQTCAIYSKGNTAKIYNKDRVLLAVADKENDLYIMRSYIYDNVDKGIYVNSVSLTEKEKWHRALGHVNFRYLNK